MFSKSWDGVKSNQPFLTFCAMHLLADDWPGDIGHTGSHDGGTHGLAASVKVCQSVPMNSLGFYYHSHILYVQQRSDISDSGENRNFSIYVQKEKFGYKQNGKCHRKKYHRAVML